LCLNVYEDRTQARTNSLMRECLWRDRTQACTNSLMRECLWKDRTQTCTTSLSIDIPPKHRRYRRTIVFTSFLKFQCSNPVPWTVQDTSTCIRSNALFIKIQTVKIIQLEKRCQITQEWSSHLPNRNFHVAIYRMTNGDVSKEHSVSLVFNGQ
jgi:hypothetical protein